MFDVTRRKVPRKKEQPIELQESKDFATEEQGMSMTIGNEDYDEREDESLMDPEIKAGRSLCLNNESAEVQYFGN